MGTGCEVQGSATTFALQGRIGGDGLFGLFSLRHDKVFFYAPGKGGGTLLNKVDSSGTVLAATHAGMPFFQTWLC